MSETGQEVHRQKLSDESTVWRGRDVVALSYNRPTVRIFLINRLYSGLLDSDG